MRQGGSPSGRSGSTRGPRVARSRPTGGADADRGTCRQLGLDHAIDDREEDFQAEVMCLTAGRVVDVVLDTLSDEALELPDDGGQRILVYRAEPGSPSDATPSLLGSWAATSSDVHANTDPLSPGRPPPAPS